ncbi:MAG: glycosyltransferase family 2 protein [Methanobrevibacter sp.]|jgi:glycosyltransferase involved in cell wall biosynthesis|nr:glycosyltransferase family 2 protein [Candidatus Methanovirga procula]
MNKNIISSKNSDDAVEDTVGVFIVVPAFNEEKTVGSIVEELAKRGYKIVIVDDGSVDRTYEIVKGSKSKYPDNVFILHHPVNRGLGAALKTGMIFSLLKGADYVVTFDADGQHAFEDVKNVCLPLKLGNAQVVIGARPFEDMPTTKRFANNMMNFMTFFFYKIKVKDSQSGLRAFKSEVIPKLNILSRGYGVSSEFIKEIHKNHLELEEVTIKTIYTDETQNKGTNIFVGMKILFKMIIDVLK